MIKILSNIWSKFDQKWPSLPNLYPEPETSGQMLKRILRELITLVPMVYRNIHVYYQIFEISLVKLRDFLGNLTIVILKSTRLGFDFKTDSKRILNALSNGIYKMVFLRPDFLETLVKVDQKLVSLTIFISKFDFVGMNIMTDSKRAFYALSNSI